MDLTSLYCFNCNCNELTVWRTDLLPGMQILSSCNSSKQVHCGWTFHNDQIAQYARAVQIYKLVQMQEFKSLMYYEFTARTFRATYLCCIYFHFFYRFVSEFHRLNHRTKCTYRIYEYRHSPPKHQLHPHHDDTPSHSVLRPAPRAPPPAPPPYLG